MDAKTRAMLEMIKDEQKKFRGVTVADKQVVYGTVVIAGERVFIIEDSLETVPGENIPDFNGKVHEVENDSVDVLLYRGKDGQPDIYTGDAFTPLEEIDIERDKDIYYVPGDKLVVIEDRLLPSPTTIFKNTPKRRQYNEVFGINEHILRTKYKYLGKN